MRNVERAAATRARLIEAARARFARDGYAATGTDAILADAGATRGALYHHFADKAALFEAVCRRVSEAAAAEVMAAAQAAPTRLDGLIAGSVTWIAHATGPEVRRILLVDAPTVLGIQRWRAIDGATGARLLREGLAEARAAGEIVEAADPALLADLINGALNGLAIRLGEEPVEREAWEEAVADLFRRYAA